MKQMHKVSEYAMTHFVEKLKVALSLPGPLPPSLSPSLPLSPSLFLFIRGVATEGGAIGGQTAVFPEAV